MASSYTLSALRHQLDARAVQLHQEIAASKARVVTDPAEPAEQGDRREQAEAQARDVVADGEMERDRAELRDIIATCQRIDLGLYGTCIDCDQSIPAQRLQVQPASLRCLACQGKLEHRSQGAHG